MSVALGPAAVYSPEQVERILEQVKPGRRPSPTRLRNYSLLLLLYRTGMRRGEAINLQLTDLRLGRETPMLVINKGKTKNAQRTIGVSPDAAAALRAWLEVRRRYPGTHVFCRIIEPSGSPLQGRYVHALVARSGKKADVERAHPHGMRATLAVELIDEGASLPVVRDVLGHGSIATTDAYLRRTYPEKAVAVLARRGLT